MRKLWSGLSVERAVMGNSGGRTGLLRTCGLLSVVAFALAFGGVAFASAGSLASPAVVQVEAAFLVNFVRYTDWPPARFADAGSPYIITVVGSPDVADTVAAVASAAGDIRGRRIEVRRMALATAADRGASLDKLRESHLVFVHTSAKVDADVVIGMVRGQPVLTVGDVVDFATDGGMLGLVQSRSHLAFEANPSAIHGAGILVSAKVLKLARIRGDEG